METMRRLLIGDALSAASREQLVAWLVANKTGDKRLRAELPRDWRVGDKTGTGGNGAANDVAIVWPPGRPAILVAAYYAESDASDADSQRRPIDGLTGAGFLDASGAVLYSARLSFQACGLARAGPRAPGAPAAMMPQLERDRPWRVAANSPARP